MAQPIQIILMRQQALFLQRCLYGIGELLRAHLKCQQRLSFLPTSDPTKIATNTATQRIIGTATYQKRRRHSIRGSPARTSTRGKGDENAERIAHPPSHPVHNKVGGSDHPECPNSTDGNRRARHADERDKQ